MMLMCVLNFHEFELEFLSEVCNENWAGKDEV